MADKKTTYKGIPVIITDPYGVMVNELRHLPDERYLEALKRIRALIEAGLERCGYDDTTPGCKNTECSWGLCQQDKSHWPDAKDQIWPDMFEEQGRVAPLRRDAHQWCPLDGALHWNAQEQNECEAGWGCFYRCAFFKSRKARRDLTKEHVLERYDKAIEMIERRKAEKEAQDA